MREPQHLPHPRKIELHLLPFLRDLATLPDTSVLLHEGESFYDEIMPVIGLALEGMVDVAEAYREEHDRVVRVESIGTEEVIESIGEAVPGVEDVAVQHQESDIHLFGRDGLTRGIF